MRTQTERSAATRRKLIASASELFIARGFAHVSADEIVAKAGLTRGALQHHFKDKTGLFQAVYEELAQRLSVEFLEQVPSTGAIKRMMFALGFLFDACERRDVARIMLVQAPAALGWDRWRELEEQYVLGLLAVLCAEGIDAGALIEASPQTLATIIFGAIIEAELLIAHAQDPALARREGEQIVAAMLAGLMRKPASAG